MKQLNLKAYTDKAKELEIAIYTQKRLIEEHKKIINDNRPIKPENYTLTMPVKPKREDYKILNNNNTIEFVTYVLGGIFSLWLASVIPVIGIFLTLFCCIGAVVMFLSISSTEKLEKSKRVQYDLDMIAYNRKLTEYEEKQTKNDKEYNDLLEEYNMNLKQYNIKTRELIDKHNNILIMLKNTLEKLYNENVIFPKYRNLIAITAINEYLVSGRCSELEGANGAYNLYEMELRQNIIINQLSNIIDNLEKIRDNQYVLYTELVKSNNTINEIIGEIKELNKTTKLNSYFNAVTAIASISPKIYRSL